MASEAAKSLNQGASDKAEPKRVIVVQSGTADEGDNYDSILDRLKLSLTEQYGETVFEYRFTFTSNDEIQEKSKEWQSKLDRIVGALNARATYISQKVTDGAVHQYVLVRKNVDEQADFIDVRVACVGNVDAGKSTLLGVLTHGELDNGRGLARQRLFRHKHESETGRTSSVGNDILGFASDGRVVNRPQHGHLDWSKVCEESSKIVTFIDLAGHERYLKTTVFGMTGHQPDYCMLLVGANAGVVGMTKEHLGLALALQVPVFVVVTKVDMCPANVLDETVRTLTKLLKSAGSRKMPLPIETASDVVCAVRNFSSERLCPLFKLSSVTGAQLDLLKLFLNLLPARSRPAAELDAPAEFAIDDTFNVPGVGTVVSGTVLRGTIRLGETLLLGPDASGKFAPVPIRSIQRKRLPVSVCAAGQSASFALKKVRRTAVRKGMVLAHPSAQPRAAWHFSADMLVLHHPTTIAPGYQAVVHVGAVRQTAAIVSMNREQLRTGDRASVRFRFVKAPEYLVLGAKLIFREGRTKAVGTITAMHPDAPPPPPAASSASKRLQKRSAAAALLAPAAAPGSSTSASSGLTAAAAGANSSAATRPTTTAVPTGPGSLTRAAHEGTPQSSLTGPVPSSPSPPQLATPTGLTSSTAAQQFAANAHPNEQDVEPNEIDDEEPMDAVEETILHGCDGAQRSKKPRRRTVSSESGHASTSQPPSNPRTLTPTHSATVSGSTGARRQSIESSNTSLS